MSIPWEYLEVEAALTALSLLSLSPSRSSPLLYLESLGFLPGNYLQSILGQAACQILKKQSKNISKLHKGKQSFRWICVQNANK